MKNFKPSKTVSIELSYHLITSNAHIHNTINYQNLQKQPYIYFAFCDQYLNMTVFLTWKHLISDSFMPLHYTNISPKFMIISEKSFSTIYQIYDNIWKIFLYNISCIRWWFIKTIKILVPLDGCRGRSSLAVAWCQGHSITNQFYIHMATLNGHCIFVYEPTPEQFVLSLFGLIEINKLTRWSVDGHAEKIRNGKWI